MICISEVMDSALEAGTRRRALALLATPASGQTKRPLKKSPTDANGGKSVVTPDPKRFMSGSEAGSETKSTAATSVASDREVKASVPMETPTPVELFSDTPAQPMETLPDTQVDEEPMNPPGGDLTIVYLSVLLLISTNNILIEIYMITWTGEPVVAAAMNGTDIDMMETLPANDDTLAACAAVPWPCLLNLLLLD